MGLKPVSLSAPAFLGIKTIEDLLIFRNSDGEEYNSLKIASMIIVDGMNTIAAYLHSVLSRNNSQTSNDLKAPAAAESKEEEKVEQREELDEAKSCTIVGS
ncbi:hypothetical protein Cni_G10328 [Canna indica]|uniref:Uncharacterized protein n=1 Tax=Canna indica TaxID=4628 RepID=A0AAQ3Q783_9LILI|nr:hypothetical protein Cni_G10328 [Canna indica]